MKTDICCYLENRERKRLPNRMDAWLDPDHTAVVCIDMHRGHLGTEPDVTCPAPRARAVIGAHNQFHKACRGAGIPVIMCQHWQRYLGLVVDSAALINEWFARRGLTRPTYTAAAPAAEVQ